MHCTYFVYTLIGVSLVGFLAITLNILLTSKHKTFAYRLIMWIMGSQAIAFVATLPLQQCYYQAIALSAAQMVTVVASTYMAIGVHRCLQQKQILNWKFEVLGILFVIVITQSVPIAKDQYSETPLVCLQYCTVEMNTTSFWFQTGFIILNCLVTTIFVIRLCLIKRDDVQIGKFFYAFPIVTTIFFAINFFQDDWLMIISLTPGIIYMILFGIAVYNERTNLGRTKKKNNIPTDQITEASEKNHSVDLSQDLNNKDSQISSV